MMTKGYLIFGALILILYAVAGITGWEYGTPPREKLTADARHSPGGHRSSSSWHSGYRGGK